MTIAFIFFLSLAGHDFPRHVYITTLVCNRFSARKCQGLYIFWVAKVICCRAQHREKSCVKNKNKEPNSLLAA